MGGAKRYTSTMTENNCEFVDEPDGYRFAPPILRHNSSMNRIQCEQLLRELARHRETADHFQCAQIDRVVEFVQSCDTPWRRSHLAGHLTASTWIVDESREHALLVHHKKLNCWLQPGGHIDDDDATFLDAALREAREETGLDDLALAKLKGASQLFDVDVHAIPARRDEPEHFHYDLRFCFVADRSKRLVMDANESIAASWFAQQEILSDRSFDSSVQRMAIACIKRSY